MPEIILTDKNFKDEVLKSKLPVLVDFWAPWCIEPNTFILTGDSGYKRANKIKVGQTVICFDGKRFKKSKITELKSSSSLGHCVRIKTETGRIIKTTDDHRFYTPSGWIKAIDLKIGQKVAIYPFKEPITVRKGENVVISEKDILAQTTTKMQVNRYITELKQRDLLPLRINSDKILILARLVGALFSDGNLYSQESNNYRELSFNLGRVRDVEEIKSDLKQLGFLSSTDRKINQGNILDRSFTQSSYRVRSHSTALWLLFKALGVPEGNKTNINYQLPKWIKKAPSDIQREFLSGYLGGDGPKVCMRLVSRKNKKPYNKLHINDIEFHKKSTLAKSGLKFAQQITNLLSNFGVKISKIFIENEKYIRKDGTRSKIIHIRFQKDFSSGYALCQKIGYNYCQQKTTNAFYVGEFLRKRLYQRQEYQKKRKKAIILYKKRKMNIKRIAKKLNLPYDTVFGWLVYGKKATTFKHLEKYHIWLKQATKNLKENLVWEKIQSVTPIYLKRVQKLTLDKVHNFIANGFLVHNCGPCRMIAPVIEEIAKEFEGKLKVGKINIDENKQTAGNYNIMSIPTLLIFKNGKVVDQMIGALPKSKIVARLKKFI